MTVETISWSISTKECCRPRRGLTPRPGLQSDAHPTVPPGPAGFTFGLIVYNWPKVCIHQNFLKVVVHLTITDQYNQTSVTSGAVQRQSSVKPDLVLLLGHWQTVQTQIKGHRWQCLTRICTVCLNDRKLRVKWNSPKSPLSGPFSQPLLWDKWPTSAVSTLISCISKL